MKWSLDVGVDVALCIGRFTAASSSILNYGCLHSLQPSSRSLDCLGGLITSFTRLCGSSLYFLIFKLVSRLIETATNL